MSALQTSRSTTLFLGRYEPIRPLAKGGMGKVFLGRHLLTGEQVVIKLMHEELAQDPMIRNCFFREIQTMMDFRHPHAVALLDASPEEAVQPCLIMEYVPGVTLEDLATQKGRFSPLRLGKIMGQICSVLHAAHHAGILHRDLTAANVMVINPGTDNEIVKVMDFGLARPGGGGFYVPMEKLSGGGGNIGPGTPDYISPEQIRGETVDQRADLYSLGVLAFRLLTGRLPFQEAQQLEEILQAHQEGLVPSFAELGFTDIPKQVETVVRKCLAKYPGERPSSAQDLALEFEKALGQKILPENAFPELKTSIRGEKAIDPETILDRLEAWMPEQIAVMKLRGFIEEVGGEVVDSIPGLLGVQILDPRSAEKTASTRGFFAFLGFGRKTLPQKFLRFNLHMKKKEQGQRSLVEITVALRSEGGEGPEEKQMRAGFTQRLCRELRAYLMIG
jgi:serine/threonine protein kinase